MSAPNVFEVEGVEGINKLTLLGTRVLVRLRPMRDTLDKSGLILAATGEAGEDVIQTGTVLAVGHEPIKKGMKGNPPPIAGLEKGDVVAFLKFYRETHTNKQLQACLEDDIIFVEPKDILLVLTEDEADRIGGL